MLLMELTIQQAARLLVHPRRKEAAQGALRNGL
jgi:hypothetical protein